MLPVLLVQLCFVLRRSASTERYVRPITSTACPSRAESCLTLNDYVSNAAEYFTSDTIFRFLEGEHLLNVTMELENVTNITLSGNGTMVTVAADSSMSFVGSRDIFVGSLAIQRQGGVTMENASHSMLIFENSHSVQMSDISFNGNRYHSRAVKFIQSTADVTSCSFNNGHSEYGGAIFVDSSNVTFSGTNTHTNNIADVSGGAINANNSMLVFNGANTFLNNKARTFRKVFSNGGSAVFLSYSSVEFNEYVEFRGNGPVSTNDGLVGVALLVRNSTISINGRSIFAENFGGAMGLHTCTFSSVGQAEFLFNERNEGSFGGALFARSSTLSFSGELSFINNTVNGGVGGAISAFNSTLILRGYILFANNTAEIGGAVYIERSRWKHLEGNLTFVGNFGDHKGGALFATNSTVEASGTSNYIGNTASKGGAVGLERDAEIVLQAPVTFNFERNQADLGGAIYYSDLNILSQCQDIRVESDNCFFKVEIANPFDFSSIRLRFISNQARRAGAVLYGGSLQLCKVQVNGVQVDNDTLTFVGSVSTIFPREDVSLFSSDALRVCFCDQNVADCSIRNLTVSVNRGQRFVFSVLTVGQLDTPVPAGVRAYIDDNDGSSILDPQSHIVNETRCTDVEFRVFTEENDNMEELIMFPDGPCGNIANTRTLVNVTLEACPPGFDLDGGKYCKCEKRLLMAIENESRCNIDTGLIQKPSGSWIQPVWDLSKSQYLGFIWSPNCRVLYCRPEAENDPILLNFSNPDADNQCSENRTGILCGKCKQNHSLTLSSFQCTECNNKFISLLLFFAFAGVALIAVLLALQMTVAAGTLNGLILYANVINICRDLFFPPNEASVNPLTLFIAWLNLDLGIPTCFYDGLDYYSYSWLEFAFPLYLWFLIGAIIVSCRFSTKIGKLFGSNPVAVLATVILMSYTKLLQTAVEILSYKELEYPDGRRVKVWYGDPNIPFLQGGHIVLSIAAIFVVVFLLLPYIFLIMFGYRLQACSGRKGFLWFNNFKPLLDAYYAPYKKETRYWTGFLLLIRAILFLSFVVITSNEVNLVAVTSLFAAIAIIPWLSSRIYEKLYVDVLEASFILNLCILTSVTYHTQAIEGNQITITYASTGIAFAEFIGIVIFHICCRLKVTKFLLNLKHTKWIPKKISENNAIEMDNQTTNTVVELREPLLED